MPHRAPGLPFAPRPAVMLRIHDVLLHTLALCLLVAGMAAIHKDVRRHVVNIVSGDAMSELAIVVAPVNQMGRFAFEALRDYQSGNSLLVLFGLVAVVLFAMMFRS